ncbi:MAG TPA: hypothetical protein VK773_13565 [Acidimicrobiales bacterium]|nr:hypothetical protein [Acidimicrobiales bacterium]
MALSRLNHWQRACALMGAAVFLVALLGGLLAAAGSGGGSPAVAASNTSAGAGSGSAQLPAAVKAEAERALVRSSDLPSGWVESGAIATSQGSAWSEQLAGCVGVPERIARIEPTKLSSPSYTSADHTAAVEDSISVYPTTADARAAFAAMADGKTPGCMNAIGGQALRASVQNEAGSGASVGTVSITKLAPGSHLGRLTGYSVTIPLVSGDRQLTITSTAIQFVHGRFVHQLTFNGNGVAFPALLQVHLTQVAEARS